MLTFLFWNINKNPIAEIIKNLVDQHQVDVLMLVECEIAPGKMLEALNAESQAEFSLSICAQKRILVFTRFSREFMMPVYESARMTIRVITLPEQQDFLLAVVHFPSKIDWSGESQSFEVIELIKEIRTIERKLGHTRTIMVGDFNMNPFETGMVAASGLNAVNSRKVAYRNSRTVQGKNYHFFYNPMWEQFGDSNDRPGGTYYIARSEQVAYYWNIFDQVLIRPEIMNYFRNEDLKILTSDSVASFLSVRGIPKSKVSDHLPVFFKLNLK
jgi:hypothetical protein